MRGKRDKILKEKAQHTALLKRLSAAHAKHTDLRCAEYVKLPVHLAKIIYKQRSVAPFRLYLALKFRYGGQVRRNAIEWEEIARELGYKDTRRIKVHAETLLQRDILGVCSDWLYIRGINRVSRIECVRSRKAVAFKRSDLANFREWTLAALIANSIRNAQKKAHRAKPLRAAVNQCANSTIAKELGVSCTMATKLKQRAQNKRYLRYTNTALLTRLSPSELAAARQYADRAQLNVKALFVKRGGDGRARVYEQQMSQYTLNLRADQPRLQHIHNKYRRGMHVSE